MSVPSGAFEVRYQVSVGNLDGDVFVPPARVFPLEADGQFRTVAQLDAEYQAVMDSYVEEVNTAYPASGGYTVNGDRTYTCRQTGDTWPV